MRKKIKLKRRKKHPKLKIMMLLSLTIISFVCTYKILSKIKIYSSNEEFIRYLLNNSSHYETSNKNILDKFTNFLLDFNLNKPVTILKTSFNYDSNKQIYEDDYNPDNLNSKYIADPNPTSITKPSVYIYNSHQLENYSSNNYEAYNITPNVMMAAYLLREKLNNLGVKTIVEEADITEFIRINNWNYNYSYVASRYYIEDAIKNNPSLELFIDLHRDSLSKANSTIEIENKNYAKVLFVVGLEHDNYQKNLDLANNINNKIVSKYASLSRGVITKSGANVDGIYNQDLNPNMLLMELGGQENTIEEVLNTIEIISPIIKEYLNEKK